MRTCAQTFTLQAYLCVQTTTLHEYLTGCGERVCFQYTAFTIPPIYLLHSTSMQPLVRRGGGADIAHATTRPPHATTRPPQRRYLTYMQSPDHRSDYVVKTLNQNDEFEIRISQVQIRMLCLKLCCQNIKTE